MKIVLSNSILTATILHKGAQLCSLKRQGIEYMWNGNPTIWGKHSPILFPIVGTLNNDSYNYQSQKYHLPRHGFARDLDFEIVSKSTNYVKFSLQSDEQTLRDYPFEFKLFIIYELLQNELKISFEIQNLNAFSMPFSIGAHPAFALDNGFEKYALEFEHAENLEVFKLENDLISTEKYDLPLVNKLLPLRFSLFENDALIMKKLKSKRITILNQKQKILAVSFDDFPNLGLWAKSNADFICIEPWCGYADIAGFTGDIMEKEGMEILKPTEKSIKSYSIEIY